MIQISQDVAACLADALSYRVSQLRDRIAAARCFGNEDDLVRLSAELARCQAAGDALFIASGCPK